MPARSKGFRHSTPRRPDRLPVVALVTDAVYPYSWGGRELRYHEYASRMAEIAELHIFTMHWWSGPRTFSRGNVTFHAISPKISMYRKSRRSVTQAILFALVCLKLLWHRFDVLEADHMPYFHILTLKTVSRLKRKRFVVTWHEVWGRSYWREYLGPLWFLGWSVEWLAMRLPDHIVAASRQTADRLQKLLGPGMPITVAPNGIDLESIRSVQPDASASDIVVVGRLIRHKRVDMLLDAVAILRLDGIELTCRVIGDGPERLALHRKAASLGLSDVVDFRHDVGEQKDVYALMKAARVFASPSEREGFGIAVLEALACGLPVVMTSSPDNLAQHLVARSLRGEVCEPSAAGLAGALRHRLAIPPSNSDPTYEEAWLSDYSWETMTSEVLKALRIGVIEDGTLA
jgi:glycosyltransferase involved in cell wall biosynthesis